MRERFNGYENCEGTGLTGERDFFWRRKEGERDCAGQILTQLSGRPQAFLRKWLRSEERRMERGAEREREKKNEKARLP